jgi:hypothetical protein
LIGDAAPGADPLAAAPRTANGSAPSAAVRDAASRRVNGAASPAARPPTMRDVAALAGVSIATVSRVVNGVEGVRAERVACVRHAVKQLGYRRDQNGSTRPGAVAATPDHAGPAGRFP